jgi:peptidoglycan/xylan/chitin deacetylase (PgdA/CDA1 family)
MKRWIFPVLRVVPAAPAARYLTQRDGVTAVLYHSIEAGLLDRHLAALTRRYRFIPLRAYVDARREGTVDRLPRYAAVLTFDDGHASNAELLPVFRKHGVRPTIFVCTGVIGTRRHFWFRDPAARGEVEALKRLPDGERLAVLRERGFEETREYPDRQALSWEEMETMRPWVDFQPHTRFHPILPRCDAERARHEIATSRADLEGRGYSVYCFAYPDGDFTPREEALVKEAGFPTALTVELGTNDARTDPYRMKRISINDDAGVSEAVVKASGVWGRIRKRLKGRA